MIRHLKELLPRLAAAKLFPIHKGHLPTLINLTLSVTNSCNSKCKTCNIWQQKKSSTKNNNSRPELTSQEVYKIFEKIGPVFFFNISGGEPFLRSDLLTLIEYGAKFLRPTVIHIPTNGLLPKKIEQTTRKILQGLTSWSNEKISLTLKPSFDGIGEEHDCIRGVPGNYQKLLETLKLLKKLKDEFPRLKVGLGTVISTFNSDSLEKIIAKAEELNPDTYISEIAEERHEMNNWHRGITPASSVYAKVIELFKENTFNRLARSKGMELLTQAMRFEYYNLTALWLEKQEQIIPCYAGITNIHISSTGEVWPCAILADKNSLGNLRDSDYDLWTLWRSPKAEEIRSQIARKKCDCPLANQAYANMLLHPETMLKVFMLILRAKLLRVTETTPEDQI